MKRSFLLSSRKIEADRKGFVDSHVRRDARVLDRRLTQPEIGSVEQNFVQRGADLSSRKPGNQAVVYTATAERHVWIVLARDVELEGIVEDVFVAVGRAKHRDDARTLLDRFITQHDVAERAADPEDDRRGPPQYFLHSTRTDVGIPTIPVGLCGVGDEGADAVAQRVTRGVAPGQCEGEEENLQFVLRQQELRAGLVVDLGRAQGTPDVVDGMQSLLWGQLDGFDNTYEKGPHGVA